MDVMLQSLGCPGVDLGAEPGCKLGSNTGPSGTILLEQTECPGSPRNHPRGDSEYKESSILSSKRNISEVEDLPYHSKKTRCVAFKIMPQNSCPHTDQTCHPVTGTGLKLRCFPIVPPIFEVIRCRIVLSNKPQEASTGSRCLLGCLPTPCPVRLPHSNWPS
jgi:hypothetical protein